MRMGVLTVTLGAAEQFVEKVQRGVKGFADEMREKGIHVGMGSNPRCVTCGERWPCAASAGAERVESEGDA